MIGTTQKHYHIEALLGRGGMGRVYRARDTRLDRIVAIKAMRPGAPDDIIERFVREARAASALNHPNIVTIHDIITTDVGELLMVQEFVPGFTLRDSLVKPMDVARVVDITRQLAGALAAAHAIGIVHRDIKPENVMVRPDGYVKVLDFGVAKTLAQPAVTGVVVPEPQPLTQVGAVVGTPSYMSPEQCCPGTPVDGASDIFSLGVLCYEMLTARRPFVADSTFAMLQAIVTEHPTPPSRLNPGVPPALDVLVLAMLAKEPTARPTAAAIEADLKVAASASATTTMPALPLPRSFVVGRESDGAKLAVLLDRVTTGHGLVAAVIGEPGIGKTSVVDEVVARWERGPLRPIVARGKCSERLAGTEAYLPILEILDHLLRRGGQTTFVDMMRQVAPTWYVHVVPLSTGSTTAEKIREDIKTISQERMKRELAAYFQDISQVRPLVLVLEDVHWADASTVDVLNYLAGRFDAIRVLIVVTYRPSDMAISRHPFLHLSEQLKAMNALIELPLSVLGREDVEQYLSLEFPGHGFPPALAALIHEKTEGHPLFIVDLVRYLKDRGDVAEENGRWVLKPAVNEVAAQLPETVRSTIRRKIERLDEVDRKVLAVASVQGHEFETLVVSEALGLDPADVEERFEALDRVHRLVTTAGVSGLPDQALSVRYRFVHVLYQNVLYASLQPTRRASHAARVAQTLVAHAGGRVADLAAELAMLFETARDFAASAAHFHTAARHAIELFGFREALSLADRGLAAIGHVSDSAARRPLEVKLLMAKGVALRSTTGWSTPESERVYTRARQICHELDDPPELFPVLWATTLFHLIRGNLLQCRRYADQLLEQATASGKPAYLMAGHHVAGVSREFIGEMTESHRLLEQARELHDPAQHTVYVQLYGQDCGMTARAMSSRPLWALGYPDRALERARETVTIARGIRDPLMVAFALVIEQSIHLYRGTPERALAIADEILGLCGEYRLRQEAEWCRSLQGAAMVALGRVDQGVALLTDSLAVQQRLDAHLVRPHFLALLAEGLRLAGDTERGLTAVEEGFASVEKTDQHGYAAALHRERGELLARAGNAAGAEESLREALSIARQQQTRATELRAATSLARLLCDRRELSEARTVLEPIYGMFAEGFDTVDLTTARTLLSELR
jgi:predicted ATPase